MPLDPLFRDYELAAFQVHFAPVASILLHRPEDRTSARRVRSQILDDLRSLLEQLGAPPWVSCSPAAPRALHNAATENALSELSQEQAETLKVLACIFCEYEEVESRNPAVGLEEQEAPTLVDELVATRREGKDLAAERRRYYEVGLQRN